VTTTPARRTSPSDARPAAGRVLVAFAAVLAVIAVAVMSLLAAPASASPLATARNVVGVIAHPAGQCVGVHEQKLAGESRQRAPAYDQLVVGSCVAPEAGASAVPAQLLRGQQFEADTLQELGLAKNTASVPGGSIPDAIDNGQIWEIKDVQYQSMSSQFRNYFTTGQPVNLVVNPDTVVSGPLQSAVYRSGGEILVLEGPGSFDAYQG